MLKHVDNTTGSEIVMDICVTLMENGLDLSRIETYMEILCDAFNIRQINALVIPQFLSLTYLSDKGEKKTVSLKCKAAGTNLQKIETACNLIEEIQNNKLTLREIVECTNVLRSKPKESYWNRIVAYIGVAIAFTLAFAGEGIAQFSIGQWIGMVVSALVSALMIHFMDGVLVRAKIGDVFSKFIISSLLTVLLYGLESLFQLFNIKIYTYYLFMGGVMLIVSGVKFTNGARDLFSGNIVAAIIQILEAMLSTIGIAIGVLVIQRLTNTEFSIIYEASILQYPRLYLIASVLLTGAGTLFFSMYFRMDRRHLPLSFVVGALTWVVYIISRNVAHASNWSVDLLAFIPNLIAAMFATIISEGIGHSKKWPTMLILFPAIVALIPGGSLYKTIYVIFETNYETVNAGTTVLTSINDTVYTVAGLSLGILSIATIARVGRALVGSVDGKSAKQEKTEDNSRAVKDFKICAEKLYEQGRQHLGKNPLEAYDFYSAANDYYQNAIEHIEGCDKSLQYEVYVDAGINAFWQYECLVRMGRQSEIGVSLKAAKELHEKARTVLSESSTAQDYAINKSKLDNWLAVMEINEARHTEDKASCADLLNSAERRLSAALDCNPRHYRASLNLAEVGFARLALMFGIKYGNAIIVSVSDNNITENDVMAVCMM